MHNRFNGTKYEYNGKKSMTMKHKRMFLLHKICACSLFFIEIQTGIVENMNLF